MTAKSNLLCALVPSCEPPKNDGKLALVPKLKFSKLALIADCNRFSPNTPLATMFQEFGRTNHEGFTRRHEGTKESGGVVYYCRQGLVVKRQVLIPMGLRKLTFATVNH